MRLRENESESLKYINNTFAVEDQCLQDIRSALGKDGKEGINVGPCEGKILSFLAEMVGAKKIVEIGLLYGYSTLWMARALPEGGKLYSLEKEEENFYKAKALLEKTEVLNKIELICGDAEKELEKLSAKGPFDMVFIDANKAGYINYLNWAEENVRPGGLIIGDNTFLFGHVLSGEPSQSVTQKTIEKMREFNVRLSDRQKYNSIMLPTIEGMTVAQKR